MRTPVRILSLRCAQFGYGVGTKQESKQATNEMFYVSIGGGHASAREIDLGQSAS
jgi:hypothetical protein